jgi:hypothetical protein
MVGRKGEDRLAWNSFFARFITLCARRGWWSSLEESGEDRLAK